MLSTQTSAMLAENERAKNKRGLLITLLIFALVMTISSALISAAISAATIIGMRFDPAFGEQLNAAITDGNYEELTSLGDSYPDWVVLVNLFATIFDTLCAIFAVRILDKRSFASMGMKKHGAKSYLTGYGFGALLIVGAEVIDLCVGSLSIGISSDIRIGFIALAFIGYLVQGMAEEALVRGYLMMSIINVFDNRRVGVAVSVTVNSLIFAALHIGNPGMTVLSFINLFLAGVLFAVYVLRTDNLWGAAAAHAAWNFFQGHILGTEVSGLQRLPSVFETLPVGNELWNGGSFGLEGGLGVTIVNITAIVLILFLPKRNSTAD